MILSNITLSDLITILGILVTIVSISLVFLQIILKKELKITMRTQMHMHYNIYYQMARNCTRIRDILDNEKVPVEQKMAKIVFELSAIRGAIDSARTSIISYSRETIGYIPYYEHPAFPGKPMPDQVALGRPPEHELGVDSESYIPH